MNKKIIAAVAAVIVLGIIGFAAKKLFLDTAADEKALKTSDGSVIINDGQVSVSGVGGSVDAKAGSVKLNAEAGGASGQQKNIVLVVDDSGSMSERVSGVAKIDMAKTAASKFISGLTEDANLSIVVYGHKGNNTQAQKAVSCQGIDEVYYMGKVNDTAAQSKVNNLVPTGWTPIADSLKKAKDILMKNSASASENSVVLLSDGEETCGGNPIAVAQELCRAGVNVDVIGLGVSGGVETQLNNIATSGCGAYYDADTSEQMENAFIKVGGSSIDISSFGGSVNINTGGNMDLQADDGRSAKIQDGTADLVSPDGRSMKVNADGSATLDNGAGQGINLPSGSVNINDYGY